MTEDVKAGLNHFGESIRVQRTMGGDDRFYFFDKKGYLSGTTFARLALPTSKYLIGAYSEGGENFVYDNKAKALFGTALHIACLQPLAEGNNIRFWDSIEVLNEVPHQFRDKMWEFMPMFNESIAAWATFLKERLVKVQAIEFPVKSELTKTVSFVDFAGIIEFNKKEVLAIVDIKSNFKTGTKSFYVAHELQLALQRQALQEMYGVDAMVFNFSPKTSKKDIGYTLQNQSNSVQHELLSQYSAIVEKNGYNIPQIGQRWFEGEIKDYKTFNWNEYVRYEE
jgi:hypothetical protein